MQKDWAKWKQEKENKTCKFRKRLQKGEGRESEKKEFNELRIFIFMAATSGNWLGGYQTERGNGTQLMTKERTKWQFNENSIYSGILSVQYWLEMVEIEHKIQKRS